MESSTVRVRPLRFAFVVEPQDKAGLQRIFEANSSLWGGLFNFIILLFKQVPARYREKYALAFESSARSRPGVSSMCRPDRTPSWAAEEERAKDKARFYENASR